MFESSFRFDDTQRHYPATITREERRKLDVYSARTKREFAHCVSGPGVVDGVLNGPEPRKGLPASDPDITTRAWTLYEAYSAALLSITYNIVQADDSRFESLHVEDIQLQRSQAWSPLDLFMIFIDVRRTTGFTKVNARVREAIAGAWKRNGATDVAVQERRRRAAQIGVASGVLVFVLGLGWVGMGTKRPTGDGRIVIDVLPALVLWLMAGLALGRAGSEWRSAVAAMDEARKKVSPVDAPRGPSAGADAASSRDAAPAVAAAAMARLSLAPAGTLAPVGAANFAGGAAAPVVIGVELTSSAGGAGPKSAAPHRRSAVFAAAAVDAIEDDDMPPPFIQNPMQRAAIAAAATAVPTPAAVSPADSGSAADQHGSDA